MATRRISDRLATGRIQREAPVIREVCLTGGAGRSYTHLDLTPRDTRRGTAQRWESGETSPLRPRP